MGKLHRVIGVACLLVCACSAREQAQGSGPAARTELKRVELKAAAEPTDPRFDAQGKLKGSGRHLAWLELPLGFAERAGSTAREGSFEGHDLDFTKVRDYFEERLIARQLEVSDARVAFRRATPTHTQLALGSLDVTLLETNPATRTVRLLIDDLSPSSTPPMAIDVAKQELARARERLE